ncbi:MAG: outer membrane protein assembly factor [Gammaproteobacteria bacterium]|nr:outer membrane protein assembly factor [Gammaproteobacteria bacterium]
MTSFNQRILTLIAQSALTLLLYVSVVPGALAVADTPAQVKFIGVDDAAMLQNVQGSVQVYRHLQLKKPRPALADYDWQRMAAAADRQILEAVKPFGYYRAKVVKSVVDNGKQWIYTVDLGAPVVISDLNVVVDGQAGQEELIRAWRADFPLAVGARLVQPDYDAAKSRLNKLLHRLGYFDKQFLQQEIVVNPARTGAVINLVVDSGPRYRYGQVSVAWKNDSGAAVYSEEFLGRYLSIDEGQPFDADALQEIQSEMGASAYFTAVEIRPLISQAQDSIVPIEVSLQVPKRLAYGASVGVGTDTGPRAGASFENRRVNAFGHRLDAQFNVAAEKQSVVGNYTIPVDGNKRDSANLYTSFSNEDSDARDSSVSVVGIDFHRSLNASTQFSYGVSYRDERFVESNQRQTTSLLLPSLAWQTVDADDLRNPDRGYRLSASLRGADDGLGSDISFFQLNINAKGVYALGRGRILGRAQAGQTWLNAADRLPASLSYFTGGDYSVRGYAYESIGVRDSNGDLIGGENLLAASIEYEQRIRGQFALAAFVDAGDAYNSSLDLKLGVGVGARWRLPFGTIRLDVASAQDLEGDPWRLHFTIGTDL